VHRRDLLPPPRRQGESLFGDPARALCGYLPDRQGEVFGRHEFARARDHRPVRVEAFRVLAHDDQVHWPAGRRGDARARLGGADVGVEVQAFSENPGGVATAFRERWIEIVGNRAQDHAVGRLGHGDQIVADGGAVAFEGRKADFVRLQLQGKPEPRAGGFEDQSGRRRNFRPDAVSGKQEQFHRSFHNIPTGQVIQTVESRVQCVERRTIRSYKTITDLATASNSRGGNLAADLGPSRRGRNPFIRGSLRFAGHERGGRRRLGLALDRCRPMG
jgi:hypothetical protein